MYANGASTTRIKAAARKRKGKTKEEKKKKKKKKKNKNSAPPINLGKRVVVGEPMPIDAGAVWLFTFTVLGLVDDLWSKDPILFHPILAAAAK